MKKNFLSLIVLVFVISFSSCKSSSSFDSDVRKMADYRCQMKQLMAKDPSDEKAKKELQELSVKMEAFGDEMSKMKDDKDMDAKADAILKEVMDKCK